MKAFVNSPNSNTKVTWQDTADPEPKNDEIILKVDAFSINRGELALLRNRPEGWRPGQDVAGIVERPAANGQGPDRGQRITALIEDKGWAERVAVPINRLATVPKAIGIDKAAALPMAGLTSLGLLRRCNSVIGRQLIVTGANGGVGSLLVQLAALAGANVTAIANTKHTSWLRRVGAKAVVSTIEETSEKFDYILESVGGSSLEAAFVHINSGGKIISFGNSSASDSGFNFFSFFGAENATVETFFSYRSFRPATIGSDLAYLIQLIANGSLQMETTTFLWTDIADAISQLENRGVKGKIVLARPAVR